MDNLPISRLNAELETFKRDIVEKIKFISENAPSLSKDVMDQKVLEIQNLQSTIQHKTNEYFNSVSQKAIETNYTPEQVAELSKQIQENLKNFNS